VGNSEVIDELAKLKSNVDFGIFMALQKAMVAALAGDDRHVAQTRHEYRRRRDQLCSGLAELGWEVRVPQGAMYIWTRIPANHGDDDMGFVRHVFDSAGVLLSPGRGFGRAGRGYARLSLIIDDVQIENVLERLRESGVLTAR
jgi:LL-diaminopimelate aminotransferase